MAKHTLIRRTPQQSVGQNLSLLLTTRGPRSKPFKNEFLLAGGNTGDAAYPFWLHNITSSPGAAQTDWSGRKAFIDSIGGFASTGYCAAALPASNGTYANQVVSTYFMQGLQNYHPETVFVLLWDGTGTVRLTPTIGTINGASFVDNTTGRLEFTITQAVSAIYLSVRAQSASPNHVRNIRVIPLANEGDNLTTAPFREDFLTRNEPWSVYRFMDWQNTNSSPVSAWADRAPEDFCSYGTSRGCSIEIMARLCNLTGKDAWICLPHLCTDDYCDQLGAALAANFDPGIKITVEYSNETWTTQTGSQGTYIYNLYGPPPGGTAPYNTMPNQYHVSGYIARAKINRVRTAFLAAGGAAEDFERCLMGQRGQDLVLSAMLDGAEDDTDMVGCAFYFSLSDYTGLSGSSTAEDLYTAIAAQQETAKAELDANMLLATNLGIPFDAYEAGQHLDLRSAGDVLLTPFTDYQTSDQIVLNYRRSMEIFEAGGGRRYVHFNDRGPWGVSGSTILGFFGLDRNPGEDQTTSKKRLTLLERWG